MPKGYCKFRKSILPQALLRVWWNTWRTRRNIEDSKLFRHPASERDPSSGDRLQSFDPVRAEQNLIEDGGRKRKRGWRECHAAASHQLGRDDPAVQTVRGDVGAARGIACGAIRPTLRVRSTLCEALCYHVRPYIRTCGAHTTLSAITPARAKKKGGSKPIVAGRVSRDSRGFPRHSGNRNTFAKLGNRQRLLIAPFCPGKC